MVEREKNINIKTTILIATIGILNSFFYDNYIVMLFLAVIEVSCLCICLLRNRDLEYLMFYMVFLSFSMENASFVGTDIFYGFKNFRVLGLNLGIWMILPLFIKQISSGQYKMGTFPKPLRKLVKGVITITIAGIFIGLFTYAVNDNGLGNAEGSLGKFIEAIYMYIFVCIEIMTVASVISKTKSKLIYAKQYLTGSIISLAIICILCILFKNYGNRGGLESLQISNIYFLLVAAILLVVYDGFSAKEKVAISVSGVIILASCLLYNSSGKMLIMVAIVPFIAIAILIKKGVSVKSIVVGSIIVVVAAVATIMFLPRFLEQSFLFKTKYEQFISMVSFWKPGWLRNMESSPQMRITEFLNIANELISKPWYLPFGKGLMGSIQDKLGLFGVVNEFSFSNWEVGLKTYYTMHESINTLFLTNGIYGLIFLFSNLKYMMKKIHTSPWLIFGFLWFLLFYSYSITISIYGVIAMVVGYIEADEVYHYNVGG